MSCWSRIVGHSLMLLFISFMFGGCALFTVNDSSDVKRATYKDIESAKASSERSDNIAIKAFDNDKLSRWESVHGIDNTWLMCKLKPGKLLESMKILWEKACASEYEIKVSEDGKNWQTVSAVFDGAEGEERSIRFAPVTTRYLGIFCNRRIGDWGYSILEVELNPVVLLPEDKVSIVEASASSEGDAGKAMDAVDGNTYTRWESKQGIDPQWLQAKLDSPQKIRIVKVIWEKASARKYEIQASMDGTNWKTVAKINDGKEEEQRVISFSPTEAEYVRMFGKTRNGEWGYSIFEFEIYR
ncbi:MAG: discoidin domain-containing protein [Elusimicrobiota bacterium]